MKQVLYLAVITLSALTFLSAQTTVPYRVVFDLTSNDSLNQKAVMRWIHEITEENPKAELEIVMYGKGYELVMPDRSTFTNDIKTSIVNPNISFKVCAVALKNNKVDKSQLLTGVQTVPDGIYEIISKQHDGWGYIKVAH